MNRSKREHSGQVKYADLFGEFFRIGIFTIGGGMAMIPQIQQVAVKDRQWLTEEEMLDCIAVSQSLPGVIAINSATYIGSRLKGIRGAAAATAGVILPSFLIIIAAVLLLRSIGENSYVQGAFTGVKAAVCALIAVTAAELGRKTLKNAFQWIVMAASFAAIVFFGLSAVWVILAAAVSGVIYSSIKIRREHKDTDCGKDRRS